MRRWGEVKTSGRPGYGTWKRNNGTCYGPGSKPSGGRYRSSLQRGTSLDSNCRIADPSKYPQQVYRGLARLLSRGEVRGESARLLAKHIGDRLPPGWGELRIDKGCSALTGTSDEQLRKVVYFLQEMEIILRAVPSTANRNMPTMSHRMVHAMPASRSGV